MIRSILDTDIYGITSEAHSLGRSNPEIVSLMIEAGITVIQYREKDKSMKSKYDECRCIREMTARAGVTLIVNDHPDLALAVGADGVHVGQDDLPVPVLRQLLREEMIIGLSTHSPAQADEAASLGVDYIGVGPVFGTRTKKDACASVGLDYIDYIVAHHTIPFVAIGGIKEHHLGDLVRHGASCVAMVTEIVSAENVVEQVQRLRQCMVAPGRA